MLSQLLLLPSATTTAVTSTRAPMSLDLDLGLENRQEHQRIRQRIPPRVKLIAKPSHHKISVLDSSDHLHKSLPLPRLTAIHLSHRCRHLISTTDHRIMFTPFFLSFTHKSFPYPPTPCPLDSYTIVVLPCTHPAITSYFPIFVPSLHLSCKLLFLFAHFLFVCYQSVVSSVRLALLSFI